MIKKYEDNILGAYDKLRPIVVSNGILRIIDTMANQLLMESVRLLGKSQTGFMKSQGTHTNILKAALNTRLLNQREEPFHLCFIDLKSAFCRVDVKTLFRRLEVLE